MLLRPAWSVVALGGASNTVRGRICYSTLLINILWDLTEFVNQLLAICRRKSTSWIAWWLADHGVQTMQKAGKSYTPGGAKGEAGEHDFSLNETFLIQRSWATVALLLGPRNKAL
jgi:hypothetical protein